MGECWWVAWRGSVSEMLCWMQELSFGEEEEGGWAVDRGFMCILSGCDSGCLGRFNG